MSIGVRNVYSMNTYSCSKDGRIKHITAVDIENINNALVKYYTMNEEDTQNS